MAQGRTDHLQGQRVRVRPASTGRNHDRARFHAAHLARATDLAKKLLAEREVMQGAWLGWVAGQLYCLERAEYAAMVRRELQRLALT